MGHRERCEAADRALSAGEKAFKEGKPVTSNPYKKPIFDRMGKYQGGWSLYSYWDAGFIRAEQKQNKESKS